MALVEVENPIIPKIARMDGLVSIKRVSPISIYKLQILQVQRSANGNQETNLD